MSRYMPGDVLARRKGVFMHKGIALGDGRVLHNTPGRGEHISSDREFGAGRRVHVEQRSLDERRRTLERVYDYEDRRTYNVLTNNCEHTVQRHVDGRASSPQLRGWALGIGLAAVALAATRHPGVAAAGFALGQRLGRGKSRRR